MRTFLYAALVSLAVVACSSSDSESKTAGEENRPADEQGSEGSNGTAGGEDSTDSNNPGEPSSNSSPDDPSQARLAVGMTINDVAVFQGVKVAVVKGRANVKTRPAPVIANRAALIRAYVTLNDDYAAHEVEGELVLKNGDETLATLHDSKTIKAVSTDKDLKTTFNFEVPEKSLPVGVTYSISLHEKGDGEGSGDPAQAQYPDAGSFADLGVVSNGDKLKVKLVPVRYDADGSQRLPDTSAAQVERYRDAIYRLYPAAEVELTVRAPFVWSSTIAASGNGFGRVLQAIVDLREQDRAPKDVYYMGVFAPSANFGSFCRNACVTGLSGLIEDPRDSSGRASVGVGFTGEASASTAAHEIGHAHGLPHAPCGGASGADTKFPYAGGGIGVWGYDLLSEKLVSPTDAKDMMGYCDPQWISDYNYQKLFARMAYVNGVKTRSDEVGNTGGRFRFVNLENGSLSWGNAITLRETPANQPRAVEYVAADGTVQHVTGYYYPYDHIDGGYLLVPEPSSATTQIRIRELTTKSRVLTLVR